MQALLMRVARRGFDCLEPRSVFWTTHRATQSLDRLQLHYGLALD
jgi:hypothetical protein